MEAAFLAHLFQPKTIVPSSQVTKSNLCAALNVPHAYAHYTGHAFHDPRHPADSSLFIDGDTFTCGDFAGVNLQPYHLITLSACETGITTHQTIDTEYVGLVSAFLSRGTNYVVSSLWQVDDLASSLLMMTFYIHIKGGCPAPRALQQSADWLRNLTYAGEASVHQRIYHRLPPNSLCRESINSSRRNAEALAQAQPDAKPYSDPKYWAAFTISGYA